MTQFVVAVMALPNRKSFAKQWHARDRVKDYWEAVLTWCNYQHPHDGFRRWELQRTHAFATDYSCWSLKEVMYLLTTHLVGSALSDPISVMHPVWTDWQAPFTDWLTRGSYQMDIWYAGRTETELPSKGTNYQYVKKTLSRRGKVVPGYSHAVLRKTDPRWFTAQMEFGKSIYAGW